MKNPMNKHTPGPWHVQDNDGAYCMVRGKPETYNNGQSIAQIWLQGSDFNDANARLIAAAPELLGWLKAVVAQMQYERPQAEKVYCNGQSGLFGMEEILLKIIAKAEGEVK